MPKLRRYFIFFVVSGFCGLVYEVVWLRLAMANFGVTTALASIVLSMFMAGLGLGSWGAGVLVRRGTSGPAALRLYSLAEFLVGMSALLVPYELKLGRIVLQHVSSAAAWQSSFYYVLSGTWIAITLVPWCACMGSTFPLLLSVIRQTESSQRSFSYLYVANVLGALLGTLASAFALIELLGFRGTLYIAGSMNAMLALSAFGLSRGALPDALHADAAVKPPPAQRLYGLPANGALYMLFTTGLVSMGLEIVWIRQFTPYLGNLVYAFATILALYLLATSWGSRNYRIWVRSHLPGESGRAWILLALFAILPTTAADPELYVRLGGVELAGLRLFAIVLFCAHAGFLTPLLVDSFSSGDPQRAGKAYAVNVLGSIFGPLLAGFILLPRLGERRSAVALALLLFGLAAIVIWRKPFFAESKPRALLNPKFQYGLAFLAAILLVRFSHDFEKQFAHRTVRRDYTATVIATGEGFDRRLLVNGIGMTSLTPITKYMAHLPLALMTRPPQNGLVICFGMGTSFRSMLSWGIPTTAVDLVPSVPKLFGYFHHDAQAVQNSPNAWIVVDDGRRFLDGSSQFYDVIVVDPPPPPEAAGSSLLYSQEFYEVLKRHLRRGGILQIWYPAAVGDTETMVSIAKALQQSFPFVRAFLSFDRLGIHFLASSDPWSIASSTRLAARMPAAAIADFVEWGPGARPQEQFDLVLSRQVPLQKIIGAAPRTPTLTDNRPINEYFALRRWFHSPR